MNISLDIYLTMSIAAIFLFVGMTLKGKIEVLRTFCIPAPVAGGILFALLSLFLNVTKIAEITLDTSLQTIFMNAFFTTVGFTADFKMIKRGGILVGKFIVIVTLLVFLQDVLGVILSYAFGIEPLLGLCIGSISMTGGHGNAASFGPMIEEMGVIGASAVSLSAATFGLVAGSIIGGPIARRLIERHKVALPDKEGSTEDMALEKTDITSKSLISAAAQIFIVMGIGSIISERISALGITLPSFIGALVTAVLARNICDILGINLSLEAIEAHGEVCLNLFLSLALISLKLWELLELALPMLAILAAQTLLMAVFAYFITFYAMGKNYTACCIAAGLCGFGMGATPNAMANMEAVTLRYGECRQAFIVVAVVGGLFVNFANSAILTIFINILGK